jgi:hypothetical protein
VKLRALIVLISLGLSACGEDPFLFRWQEDPMEDVLYSLDREELNRPSGFDMMGSRAIVVESAQSQGRWDFALDRVDGDLYLLPPKVLGVINRAGIVEIPGVRYEDVQEAPSDTLRYVVDAPVRLRMGSIYVVRTHEQTGAFGQRCFFYGRVEPLSLDSQNGVMRFKHDTSPDCNNRSLIPPK